MKLTLKKSHVAILLLMALIPNSLQAQRLLKKELKESSGIVRKTDGFTFKWYEYSYLDGEDTVYAAFDLSGKRITPNSKHRYTYNIYKNLRKGDKPSYCGGGVFSINDSLDAHIIEGYNKDGKLIFPGSLGATFIYAQGDGIFILEKHLDAKQWVYAAYNSQGQCLISFSLGYNWIVYYPESKCFWCEYKDASGKSVERHTYSADAQYFAVGYYYSGKYSATGGYDLSKRDNLANFNKYKKPITSAHARTSSQQATTPTPTVASNTSTTIGGNASSANNSGLLYSGNYYMSGNGTDGYNNYTQAPSRELYIEIYDDHVVASGVYCEDASTKEWAQRNNRMICYAYAYQTYYIQGCLTEEFLKVDKKTYDVTLFIRQQNPYSSNYPNLFYFPFSKKEQPSVQYQFQPQQYPQQQYQTPQQQIYDNPQPTPTPTRQQKDCGVCYGTGKCRTCGGRGTVTNLGIGSGTHPCPNCPNQSGRCKWCNGTGKQN